MKTIITGSASGLGAAIRKTLENQGHSVIGVDIVKGEIIADLSTRQGREAAIVEVKRRCRDVVDHIVACAGIGPDSHDPPRIASVNYFGVVELLESLFDCLKRGSNPSAVVISSNSAQMRPFGDHPYVLELLAHHEAGARQMMKDAGDASLAYMGSKNAVARWARRNTMAWGQAGVRLNVVAPGNASTPMHQRNLDNPEVAERIRLLPRPLGRDGDPFEVARVVAFLLSPEASYVHGGVYYADGGIDAALRPDSF